jgi:light-regulated signal transduction histidine kinase (bacteriophytochrome)
MVLDNLLGNAWKYTAKRADAEISFELIEQNGKPVFLVADNGAGFDMRFADRLFGVFQRLHSSSEFQGTGVGLASVRRIVRRHGGDIWAEGQVGNGARFYFTLGDGPAA